jgi:hypothetical protein
MSMEFPKKELETLWCGEQAYQRGFAAGVRGRLQRLVRPLADINPQFSKVEPRPPPELANKVVPAVPYSPCSTLPELLFHHGQTPQPGNEQTSCVNCGLLHEALKYAEQLSGEFFGVWFWHYGSNDPKLSDGEGLARRLRKQPA